MQDRKEERKNKEEIKVELAVAVIENENSNRNLPLHQEESTNQKESFKINYPSKEEKRAVEAWKKKRYGLIMKSRFLKASWFKPDLNPSFEEAREAMYYEKEYQQEVRMATNPLNPYQRLSVIKIQTIKPDGSPVSISPDFRGKDPTFNQFVGRKVEKALEKHIVNNEIPCEAGKEIKKIVQTELQHRSWALGQHLIDLEDEKPTLPLQVQINPIDIQTQPDSSEKQDQGEDWDSDLDSLVENDEKYLEEPLDTDDTDDKEEDGSNLHDQEVEDIFKGNSEYLSSDLPWQLTTMAEINSLKVEPNKDIQPEPEQPVVQIFSLALEYEDEEEFKPSPEDKKRIKESFFGGFVNDNDDYFENEEPHPCERLMREREQEKKNEKDFLKLFRAERRGTPYQNKYHEYEEDDIYQELADQNNYTDEEDGEEEQDPRKDWTPVVPGLYLEAGTRQQPSSHCQNDEVGLRQPSRHQQQEEYEKLRAKHPRFFQHHDDQSLYQPFASVPSLTKQKIKKEDNTKQSTKQKNLRKQEQPQEKPLKQRKDWTTAETLGKFLRSRFPAPSGVPTVKSESDHPLEPNPDVVKAPWSWVLKATGPLIEFYVELSLLKSCFQAFTVWNVFVTIFFITLLCIRNLAQSPSEFMSTLAAMLGVSLFNVGNECNNVYRMYKKRNRSREEDLRKLKPRIQYDTSRHPSHPAVAGLQAKHPDGTSLAGRKKKNRIHIERPCISEMQICCHR